jgi:hypothetical protein
MDESSQAKSELPKKPMTEPHSRFVKDITSLLDLLYGIREDADHIDWLHQKFAELDSKMGPFAKERLAKHEDLIAQISLSRAVDGFLTYLSELLALIFLTKPEMLKSKETVTIEEVLQYETMDSLVKHIAEKKIHDLSYKGMRELAAYLSKEFGFALFEEDKDQKETVRLVELRNIIAHNRAVANSLFLSRLPDFPAKPGENIAFEFTGVIENVLFLMRVVADIDDRASGKFGLPRPISWNAPVE